MGAPMAGDPCLEPVGWPAVAGGRVRIVEILATGTSGGAQEHLFSLMSRLDRSRYDAQRDCPVGRQRSAQAPAGRIPGDRARRP